MLLFSGQARESNVPSNVTNAAVVGDKEGKTNDKQEESADTKVNVDDAVVAKAPDGEEVDFKKISVDEALKVLKVQVCKTLAHHLAGFIRQSLLVQQTLA